LTNDRYTEDFTERSKILLGTDLKVTLLDHQNNFVGIKNNKQSRKKFWYSSKF